MLLTAYTCVHLLCCWPVSSKLLLTRQLDHAEEPEPENHIKSLLIQAWPLGSCRGALIRRCSITVLLAITASKYQKIFWLIQNNVSWQNLFGCWSPSSIHTIQGRQALSFEKAGWQREATFLSLRAEFGAGRPCLLDRSARWALHVTAKLAGMPHHRFLSFLCRSKREVKQTPCLPSCRLVTRWWTSMRWNWAAPEERPSPWWKGPTRNWS